MSSLLDPGQVLKTAFDDAAGALKVEVTSGGSTSTAINDGTIPTQKVAVDAAGGLKVDASQYTVPVSAASLPLPAGSATAANQATEITHLTSIDTSASTLAGAVSGGHVQSDVVSSVLPTGAATAAKQPALGVAGTPSADVISVQGVASMTALKVDGSAVTQPVSAASLPLPTGAATSALQTTISGQLPASLGAHLTAASLSVNIASDQTVPVSAASLPLPAGAATNAELVTINSTLGSPFQAGGSIANTSFGATQATAANLNATVVGPAGATLAKDSSLSTINTTLGSPMQNSGGSVAATQSGTWNVTNVSGTVSLPTGAATSALQSTISGQLPSSLGSHLTAASLAVNIASDQTVPVSAASLPLPSGAATSALQTSGNTSLASIDGKVPSGLTVSSTRLLVDGSGATQPVSGTVTVTQATGTNLHAVVDSSALPTGAATSAKQPALGTAGTASSDVITIQGIASMTALKVDGSAVTQPVSGTVTANAGSGSFTVAQATGTNLHAVIDSGTVAATQSGTWNITNVSGTVSLPTGAATAANQATISGQLPATLGSHVTSASLAVNIASDQTVPVSAASLPLPSGASTAAKQPALGTAGTASSDVITVQGIASMTALKVDGSGVTQPVSGTVAASQSGTWNITNVSGTVSLPTGAATAAKQPALGTAGSASSDVITIQGIASMTALKVDGSAVTQPVSIATLPALAAGSNAIGTVGVTSLPSLPSGTNGIGSVTVTGTAAVTQSGTWNVNATDTGYTNAQFIRNDYTGTAVSTAAYTQLIASTSNNYHEVEIFDSSGQTLKLAVGGAGSEVDKFLIYPGGNGRVKFSIASGSRISIKAVSATASVGEIDINLYG